MKFILNTDFAGLLVVNNVSNQEIISIQLIPVDKTHSIDVFMNLKQIGGIHYIGYIATDGYADVLVTFRNFSTRSYSIESTEIYLPNSELFSQDSLMGFGWKSFEQSAKSALGIAKPISKNVFFEYPDRFIFINGKSATVFEKSKKRISNSLVTRLIQLGKDISDLEIVSEYNEKCLEEKLREGILSAMEEFYPQLGGNII